MKRLALLLIICIAGAQASLTATSLETTESQQTSEGTFLWLQEISDLPDLQISFTADQMMVEQRSTTSLATDTSGNVGPIPIPQILVPTQREPTWESASHSAVRANLTEAQAGALFTLFATESMQTELVLGQVNIQTLKNPVFDMAGGLHESTSAQSDNGASDRFLVHQFEMPVLVSESTAGQIQLTATGNLVLEMEYVDFIVQTNEGQVAVASTHQRSTVAPGVIELEERFVRLTLEGAKLQMSSNSFEGIFQVATRTAELVTTQAIFAENATGELAGLNLKGESAKFTANKLLLTPSPAGMGIAEPEEDSQWLGLMATGLAPNALWLLTPLLILPFLRRKATLPRMEQAIEAGKFARASKFASRILRKIPFEERATMGYAVAQSKMGQHDNVVRHLKGWLAKHKPTDGVFHYVLGMAYMELGAEEVARTQFAAAVQLTPSLREEIPSGPVVAEHAYA